jgi:hypothetical protein
VLVAHEHLELIHLPKAKTTQCQKRPAHEPLELTHLPKSVSEEACPRTPGAHTSAKISVRPYHTLRQGFGKALARLWQGFCKALARLWQGFGKAFARLWQTQWFMKPLSCFGKAFARLWQTQWFIKPLSCFGKAHECLELASVLNQRKKAKQALAFLSQADHLRCWQKLHQRLEHRPDEDLDRCPPIELRYKADVVHGWVARIAHDVTIATGRPCQRDHWTTTHHDDLGLLLG